jgi:hypothetical protein
MENLMNDFDGQGRKPGLQYLTMTVAALAAIFLSACTTLETATPAATASVMSSESMDDASEIDEDAPVRARAPAVTVGASAAELVALRVLVEQQNRLYTVATPLLLTNALLCKRHAGNVSGFVARTLYAYPDQLTAAASTAYRLGEQPQVMTILAGSGAAASDLRQGDIVLAVGDSKIAPGPGAERDMAKMIDAAARNRASLKLRIQRDGAPLSVNIAWSRSCAFAIELGNSAIANSYTDGRRVMLTRGMLATVVSDEELAYVLAKEIAQAALVRTPLPGMRATIDRLALAAPVSGARRPSITPYVPVTDATADKLALYMLLRAGYGIDGARDFWLRLASEIGPEIAYGHTQLHPSTSYRASVIKAVTASIKQRQLNDLPLIP